MAAPLRAPALEERLYTPDEVLLLPESDKYELLDGRLREKTLGAKANFVTLIINTELLQHSTLTGRGIVVPAETALVIFPDRPRRMPRCDGGFIRKGRLPGDELPEGYLTIPPDLVFEVASPGDSLEDLVGKAEEYMNAGVRMVWVISPRSQRVFVMRPDAPGLILGPRDTLSGDDVVEGFTVPVADLFRAPLARATASSA